MYTFWFPPDVQTGKTLLLVSLDRQKLDLARVGPRVRSLGSVNEGVVKKNGELVGRYYWRVAYGYVPSPGIVSELEH